MFSNRRSCFPKLIVKNMSNKKVSNWQWIVLVLAMLVQCLECRLTFDFIIVGSGAGGGCLARRLVEDKKFSVLLLEAGPLPRDGHDIPARAPEFLPDTGVTYMFQSVPQQNAALKNNGTASVESGRMLGGTTSLNYMWFNRGNPRDWDNWAYLTSDSSWKYENMLPYFKRSETYQGDFPSAQHGYNGPITVSRPRYAPGLEYWLAAGRELNYPVADSNGPQQRSFTTVEFAKRFGRRVSSAIGYLSPVFNNPNLKILLNTTVTQVIIEGHRAIGVRFVSNATNFSGSRENVVYATKEVILSAGTYNSPLILQRSGIGPRDVLNGADIPIIKELPVGQNLHDHAAINLNFILNNASLVFDEDRDLNPRTWQYYNLYGDGPYSNTRGATGQAILSSSVAQAEGDIDWPDYQLCMSHSTIPFLSGEDYMTSRANVKAGEAPFSSSVFIGRPKSRGSIAINPDDPVFGNPVLDMGWLTDSRDIQIFLDAIRETLRVYEHSTAYRSLNARYSPIDLPACRQYPSKSKEYWICYIRQVIQGGCHPAGTNKMGTYNDPTAVVDSELRVFGIEGLRVVDGSIMPFIVNVNPHAAIYGIAEKLADIIKARWESQSQPARGHEEKNQLPHGNVNNEYGQYGYRSPYLYNPSSQFNELYHEHEGAIFVGPGLF